MDLRSPSPYWLLHTPQLYGYESLKEDHSTEVAVIGAGISGALTAYALVKAGCRVAIITKDHVGTDSTCASTSLLQYEIDTPLHKLIEKVGRANAERSYLLCHQSIDELEKIHKEMGLSKTFLRKKSLLLASHKKDAEDLEKEHTALKAIGIKADWLDAKKISSDYGFDNAAALYSHQAAETDAYLLTQSLIQWCAKNGAKVFDKTEITDIHTHTRSVELLTGTGYNISARHVVMATGYESVKWINKNFARLHSTYVVISEPFHKKDLWKDECLIWETARPYLYMRTLPDNRVLIGGRDETFFSGHKRDTLIHKKSKLLAEDFNKKFPGKQFNIDYSWAGTFGETKDGLPYIGSMKELPRVYFALGFGGNGITFSQIAADIIRDSILRHPNPDKKLFSFNRLNYK
jgi:glycine/D-amino acid oxidase-like deaminating enzyme